MTGTFRGSAGGRQIPDSRAIPDFKRLEEAVTALVDRYHRAQHQIAALRRDLAERDQRIQSQTREIRELNQCHQDVAKRLDDLIGELDRLDAQLEETSATGS